MSIAFILPYLFSLQRGIERSTIHLANAIKRMGHQVTLITWSEANTNIGLPLEEGIRILKVPYVRYYREKWAIPFYTYFLTRYRFDSVIIFYAGHGEAQAIRSARKFRQFKTIFDVGYPYEQVPHRFEEFKKLRVLPYLDEIVVKSPFMALTIENFFQRSVRIIPYGVSSQYFSPDRMGRQQSRKLVGIPDDALVILSTAALEERKGVQFILRAMPALLEKHPQLYFLVVGSGAYESELHKLAHDLNIQGRVIFTGSVTEVYPYYRTADIFTLLSKGEGLPNALLEAWSMSLPALLSTHQPYPEIAFEEANILVEPDDLQEVIAGLQGWFDNPLIRKQAGESARKHVLEKYEWSVIAQQYLCMLNNISSR